MLTWLSANLSTLLISLVLFAVVISIVRYLIRQKKQDGKHSQKEPAHGTSRAPVPIIVDWFAGWIPAPQKDQILTIFPVFHASVVA